MADRRAAVTAHVGLGANLGDPVATLQRALDDLSRLPGTRLVGASRLYRSAPVDAAGPDFVNAVAELSTELTAPALLQALQALERGAGRQRPYRNAPRTLDLDLLLYGDGRIDSPGLRVPHPRLAQRAFVLRPLAELAPRRVTPAQLAAVREQDCTPLPGASAR
ncbi:MAG TPA: 2-amino-4-hydroxy-6-hydroxymethyldihydropteridine diphosphokinase [Ottowia sp.]|uniref:2-amino-4-hydroxy-6- hydroxymethyldihydropteridine diphosphokinase n=1 Tax=Ottowia sp. TaxID=1898956 RepID=UPI002CC48293|nr:2-amino-4-hydroxy-6-hydroxymethyldihydropteridine diphosphokinase [Ottowia sp.]HMN21897.1 2-amino-4-hydroxy-6-hydroxymethyldihydropteridine diphosphokinase [Ottowia sp.]